MPTPADELLARQQRLVKVAKDLENYKDDPKKLMEKAAEFSKMAGELEVAAKRFEANFAQQGGAEERVVLTSDQRERLAEVTGTPMEMLVVRDPDGSFAKAMPGMQKMIIERMAAKQATASQTKKATRTALDKLVKQLKGLGVPELDPVIEAIEADPTLEKLKEQQAEFARQLKEKYPDAGG
jgi:hypothetical protein